MRIASLILSLLTIAACDPTAPPDDEPCYVVLRPCESRVDILEQTPAYQAGYDLGKNGEWPVAYDEWCPLGPEDVGLECAEWKAGVSDGTFRRSNCQWNAEK